MAVHVAGDAQGPTPVIAHEHYRRYRGIFQFIPWFLYLLIAFVLFKLSGVENRNVLFNADGYKLTWVEVFYFAASVIAMIEMAKISHPGEDNVVEALLMLAVWVIYLICFVLGAAQVRGFSMFSTTEFLMLVAISLIQVVMGFIINARTLGRNITDSRLI